MDEDPAQARAPQEGLVARARRRGGARRQGVGDGLGRQHRRHDGRGAAAHGPDQGRQPPGDRHADPGARRRRPTVLLDAGANAECQPEWLVQFAQMGSVYARTASASTSRGSACCRSARSRARATRCARRPIALLAAAPGIDFIGNVEGRDLMTDAVDVVVTDGFTGNVALKTLEGGVKAVIARAARRASPTTAVQGARRRAAAGAAAAVRRRSTPTPTAARCCSASTASASSPTARRARRRCVNAIGVAAEMVEHGIVDEIHAPSLELTVGRSVRRRLGGPAGVPSVRCPPRPTSSTARSTATRSSRSSATGSPTSSRSTRRRSARASRSSTTSTPTRSR